MIAKVSRGSNVGGLLRYLMGPGQYNQHTDPRVIATWDGAPELHQPPPNRSVCGFDIRALTTYLNDPAVAAEISRKRPGAAPDGEVKGAGRGGRQGPVWHCSLRNARDDPVLSDAQWTEVASELLHRTGIAPRDDLGACRWVVIRHDADHVHVAATLVRQDNGRRVHPYRDYLRAREVCRDAERRLGLTPTGPIDRTAAERPTRAELAKTARRGAGETPREWLRRCVRIAAVQAQDPHAFFGRLADLGVMVRPRQTQSGQLLGYAVATPHDVNAKGGPVWFSGGTLARDLSLPQLQDRWRTAPPPSGPIPPAPGEHARVGRAERAEALAQAKYAARAATQALRTDRAGSTGSRDAVPGERATAHPGVANGTPRSARRSRTPPVTCSPRCAPSPPAAAARFRGRCPTATTVPPAPRTSGYRVAGRRSPRPCAMQRGG